MATHVESGHSDLERDEMARKEMEAETEEDITERETEDMTRDEMEAKAMASDELSCIICKKSFSQEYNLRRHQQNIHGSGRKRKGTDLNDQTSKAARAGVDCTMCGKVLSRIDHLKRHMKTQHNK